MAKTLTFNDGKYDLDDKDYDKDYDKDFRGRERRDDRGEKLDLKDEGKGAYVLSSESEGGIKDLYVQADDNPLTLKIVGDSDSTFEDGSINFGDDNDTLIVSTKTKDAEIETEDGDDKLVSNAGFTRLTVDMDEGDDRARFSANDEKFAAKSSSVDMGEGEDRAVFNGPVKDLTINMGTGQDDLFFKGDIKTSTVQLGNDGQRDVIRIADGAKIEGLRIEGAEEGDILYIGNTEYQYNPVDSTWVSENDVRRF